MLAELLFEHRDAFGEARRKPELGPLRSPAMRSDLAAVEAAPPNEQQEGAGCRGEAGKGFADRVDQRLPGCSELSLERGARASRSEKQRGLVRGSRACAGRSESPATTRGAGMPDESGSPVIWSTTLLQLGGIDQITPPRRQAAAPNLLLFTVLRKSEA